MGALLAGRRRLIARFGRPVTIRRGNLDGSVTSADFVGALTRFSAAQLVGALSQDDARLEMMADVLGGFPVPPRAIDEVLSDGLSFNVQFVASVHEGPLLIGWSLTLRGS